MSVIANPTLTGNELDLERLQVGNWHYRAPFTRKNLLDNWYFVGGGDQQGAGIFPINQKKQTSYSSDAYTVDRWKMSQRARTASIAAHGLTLAKTGGASTDLGILYQKLEYMPGLAGKTVTLSILVGNVSGTAFFQSEEWNTWTVYGKTYLTDSNTLISRTFTYGSISNLVSAEIVVQGPGSSVEIKAIKLELGSEQTLAHLENGVWVLNELPDYTTQLLRCQRFFHVFTSTSASNTGYGYSTNPKNLRPEMRTTPSTGSFTYSGTTYYYLDANL